MPASLPPRPSLEWLRKTAKDRLAVRRQADPHARLAEVQLELAREHGFPSWRRLKAHIESLSVGQPPLAAADRIAALLRRVRAGDIDTVRAMLDESPDLVNAHGPHPHWGGRPQPLHMAIEGNRRDVFELLIARGADVDGDNAGYDHWSPLMIAITGGRTELVERLLAHGARVGLVEALLMRDDGRVEALLGRGGLPDIAPNRGSILAFARTPRAIDLLMAHGAQVDTPDRWESTPIHAISRLGVNGRHLVEHLVARGVSASPEEYARLGDAVALERIVGADPAVAASDGVMMAAVDFGHHELVEWLLARGANVDARSNAESRHTALHSAAWNGDLRMVQLLVAHGADAGLRDVQYDATPLGWAETSVEVTGNQACAEVNAFLRERQGRD